MIEKKPIYWLCPNPLGFGDGAIKKGDLLPETYYTDKRLAKWLESAICGYEKVKDASAAQKKEIDDLGYKNLELQEKIKSLETQISGLSTVMKENKFYKSQVDQLTQKLNAAIAEHEKNAVVILEVIEALREDSLKREKKDELIENLRTQYLDEV